MKSFSRFISEARVTQASLQANKLGLTGNGHGEWLDRSGNPVAKTIQGKLVFLRNLQKAKPPQEPQKAQAPKDTQLGPPSPKTQKPQELTKPKSSQKQQEKEKEEGPTVTLIFGRFNPPTIGHEKLFTVAKGVSGGGDIKIYPSRTQDPKKNPLDPDVKVEYMRKAFPDFEDNIINDPEMISIFDALSVAYEDGYDNVNIVVGSDRQAEINNLSQKYNGELYEFGLIRVISAGGGDSETQSTSGVSASKMRKAVMDNNFQEFRRGTPKTLNTAETRALFDAVRRGMGIKKSKTQKENYNLWEIAPRYDMKNLRENYVQEKIFNLGECVQNLNTGMIGKITRRGTNHLICVTEEGRMFKSWIKDIVEYTETKMDSMYREPGKPNTLVGTLGYLKNVIKMSPGVTLGKENLQPGGKSFLEKIKLNR